jgi:hypothetical protein
MTTIPTITRFARLGLAASTIGAGLLLACMQTASAGEIAATEVSAQAPQTQSSDQSRASTSAPAQPSPYALPPLGTVGFGWG